MSNISSTAIPLSSKLKSKTYPHNPVFIILSTEKFSEMLPIHNELVIIP